MDLSWLIGRSVTEVSINEGEIWYFSFGEKANIGAECLWRIIKSGRIILSSKDHGQKFGLPVHIDAAAKSKEILAGRVVETFRVREATADITIEFDGDCFLEIIPDSSGYESWQVNEPTGVHYFAQGGGNIVKCTPQIG
jgi:hypothetical protein